MCNSTKIHPVFAEVLAPIAPQDSELRSLNSLTRDAFVGPFSPAEAVDIRETLLDSAQFGAILTDMLQHKISPQRWAYETQMLIESLVADRAGA